MAAWVRTASTAAKGPDTLVGGLGDDTIDGGAGDDTAIFAGSNALYTVTQDGGVTTVVGPDGTDTLTGVENLLFEGDPTPGNTAPSIGGDLDGEVTEDGAQTASGQLTTTDPDPGASFTYTLYSSAAGAYGVFSVSADGEWTYVLDHALANGLGDDDHPTETFLVKVDDGQGGNDIETVTVTVNGSGVTGDDLFVATSGADIFDGGAGSDTVSYAETFGGAKVNLALSGPQPTGISGKDTFISIENLIGSAYGDYFKGDGAANHLNGGAGYDTLKGGEGDDEIQGGVGNDELAGNGGIDTLSYAEAENGVTVSLLVKTAQNTAGAGIDTVGGFENLTGSGFADTLTGDKKANAIDGGGGGDTVSGGVGADLLTGGGGADVFVYAALNESTKGVSGQDRILDFSHADGDRIDLSALDANTATGADDAFALVAGFTHHAGELAQTAQGGGWLLQGDVNGDAKVDFAIFVQTAAALTGADFIL